VLQQTRVAQGLPYYLRLLQAFPTVQALAAAPEDELMKQWQGLGYYSRARNLQAAARAVVANHGGQFPAKHAALLALPGIGPYTAAAIASFAFNLPHAVVDGNVYRVLARFFGISAAINSPAGQKEFAALAQSLLPAQQAALYNQAIMEFGAMQCKPANPLCESCPLAFGCVALKQGTIAGLPVKQKAKPLRNRWFTFFDVRCQGQTLLQKRGPGDVWQGLFQFPLLETEEAIAPMQALKHPHMAWLAAAKPSVQSHYETKPHLLSHQRLHIGFMVLHLPKWPENIPLTVEMIPFERVSQFALPKPLEMHVERRSH
jgi:A/G-specific adenine glycosylase